MLNMSCLRDMMFPQVSHSVTTASLNFCLLRLNPRLYMNLTETLCKSFMMVADCFIHNAYLCVCGFDCCEN